jgi:3-isopropylmalate dehydrogenase
MASSKFQIAVIRGDSIGVDVIDAALAVIEAALRKTTNILPSYNEIPAGAAYYREKGRDIEAGIHPLESGGDMGTVAVTNELLSLI